MRMPGGSWEGIVKGVLVSELLLLGTRQLVKVWLRMEIEKFGSWSSYLMS
jgi:hypothetical protein